MKFFSLLETTKDRNNWARKLNMIKSVAKNQKEKGKRQSNNTRGETYKCHFKKLTPKKNYR